MSDLDDPSLDAKPGKYYVDQDSAPWDDADYPPIVYQDGTNLHDLMAAHLDRLGVTKNPDLKPLTGRQRIT